MFLVALQPEKVRLQQESGLRFPNLFAGLTGGNNPFSLRDLFRPGRPAQQQPPPGPGFAGNPPPLSPPIVAQPTGPNPFLQAPPPAFQQQPAAFPTFVQGPGEEPLPRPFSPFSRNRSQKSRRSEEKARDGRTERAGPEKIQWADRGSIWKETFFSFKKGFTLALGLLTAFNKCSVCLLYAHAHESKRTDGKP